MCGINNKKIVCVGTLMIDILASGVEKLPEHWEETLLASSTCIGIGGGAANSAITFAHLNQEVYLMAKLGKDNLGNLALDMLKKENLKTDMLISDDALPTSVALGIVHKGGNRCFIVSRGANSSLCQQDIYDVVTFAPDVLHINGFFQLPSLEPQLNEVLKKFHDQKTIISFDTASWDPSGKWFEKIEPFAEYIDYFFANNIQLSKLTNINDVEEAAMWLKKRGIGTVVAKFGPKGCIVFGENERVETQAYDVTIVDTTGAGDSFDAAYMIGVLNKWDIETCSKFANIVAALNCTKLGATAGLPTLGTAMEILNNF
jgi:sugar/nucleoside kinase (ribokinase family)